MSDRCLLGRRSGSELPANKDSLSSGLAQKLEQLVMPKNFKDGKDSNSSSKSDPERSKFLGKNLGYDLTTGTDEESLAKKLGIVDPKK